MSAVGGWATLAGMRAAGALLPLVPEPAARAAADLGGTLGYVLGAGARRGGASNLARVLDPLDPDLIALRLRQAFRTQAQNYVDLLRIPRLSLAEVDRLVDLEGWEHVDRTRAHGRGAILAAAHIGNIDLVAQITCARGVPVTIPVEPLEPRALLDYVNGLRTAHGLRLVPIDRGALAAVFRALRRCEVVGFAVDRDVQSTAVPTPFFGRQARLSHAPALVALRTGAPILTVATRRLANGRFHARLGEPIEPSARRGPDAVAELMARVAAELEGAVRQNPGQWVMFDPLFEEPPGAQ